MYDYIESLHRVFAKNVCPWAAYVDVEMAVFMYVINLCHKAEAVLMDHFELKILEAEIQDEEEANHAIGFGKEAGKSSTGKRGFSPQQRGGKSRGLNPRDADHDDGQDGETTATYQSRRILKRLIRIYGSSH